jgi:putative membrane protein
MGTLLAGALVAIVAVAKLMTYLLESHHDPTYGFFFGLVLVSVIVPFKMIKRKTAGTAIACIVAIAMVVGLTMLMTGEERLKSAQKKAAMKAAATAKATISADKAKGLPSKRTSEVPRDMRTMILFFIAGAIAISAMILPGISGSFMLLLMGVYFDVLACVTGRQFVLLGIFALGCLIGLVVFTRLLKFLLERFHDLTMAYLLGLVIGSLWAIWPFKTFDMAGGKRVDMDNILPTSFGQNELLTFGSFVLGCTIVAVFVWIEAREAKAREA